MRRNRIAIVLLAWGGTVGSAQVAGDESYLRAIFTIQAVGRFSVMFKDWCDVRAPQGVSAHNTALKKWRETYALDAVDARLTALPGPNKIALEKNSETRRSSFYAQLNASYKDSATTCGNLEKQLLSDFNPRKMYPEEYQTVFSRPLSGSPQSGSAVSAADSKPAGKKSDADGVAATNPMHVASGTGLQTADIFGVMHEGRNRYTISGMKFEETVGPILLKNGKAYRKTEPPEGLDVARSQRLEPETWGEWRRNGSGYEVRWQDGVWRSLDGTLQEPYPPGTKLDAAYIYRNFEGSVSYGGVASRTSYVFKPDGRFEILGFSQGSAGSMAAQNGMSSSATSSSSGEGTTTVTSTSSTSGAGGEPSGHCRIQYMGWRQQFQSRRLQQSRKLSTQRLYA